MDTTTFLRPNELPAVIHSQDQGRLSRRWPLLLTASRLLLFFATQVLVALFFLLTGTESAWQQSIPWWPLGVTLTNLVGLALLVRLFHAEGLRYRDLLRIDRQHLGSDLMVLIGALLITGPIAWFPNIWIAGALFGDTQTPANMMFRALPIWAAVASFVLFPVTQGLVELPTYFGYAAPRLAVEWKNRWLAVLFTGFFLGIQHAAIPLIFDWRFIVWRAGMYLLFALWLGLILSWRPRLMPYFAIVHILIDFSAAWFTLAASLG